MSTKTLLILANSHKRGGRCIAGREVLWLPDGRWHFGPWVRPVSAHGTGELDHEETIRADGSQVQVLEFANVALAQNQQDECQPESWIIAAALLVQTGPPLQTAAAGRAGGAPG